MKLEMQDISYEVYGKYVTGFIRYGYEWSDMDEDFGGGIKWGAQSAPGKVRARYVPGFRLWQMLGLIPKGPVTR